MKVNKKCKPFSRRRKIKAYLKRHRTGIIATLIIAGLFIVYLYLNGLGEAWRGYSAIGGEAFVFLIPFLVVSIKECVDDLIDLFK